MSFISISYLFFFTCTVLAYVYLSKKYRRILLVTASLFFYGYNNYYFVPLLLVSTLIDYLCALKMEEPLKEANRKRWLYVSISSNINLLLLLKYNGFFLGLFNNVANANFSIGDWLAPIGLSFYTLQTMGYSIDVYRKKILPERNFFQFLLYVSFFPQLVAGPIERANRLLPQLRTLSLPSITQIRIGIVLIAWGVFIKLVVADNITTWLNSVLDSNPKGFALWVACAFIMLKVYCDFLAYTEIARGSAYLFGIKLSHNFRQPFWAKTPNGFWQRWHISLTKWLIDYVQIPLLRQFPAEPMRSIVGIFTLCLIGFWHGASWNFLLFGLIHGVAIIGWKLTSTKGRNLPIPSRLGTILSRFNLFLLLSFSAPFFYISDMPTLFATVQNLVTFNTDVGSLLHATGKLDFLIALVGLVIVLFHDHCNERNNLHTIEKLTLNPFFRKALMFNLVLFIVLFSNRTAEDFVYYAF